MRILDRHLQNAVLQATAMVALVVTALAMVSTFISEADELGEGHYTLVKILQYVVLSTPEHVHIVFPVVALLGALLGLGGMAAGSELVVIRATGVSVARLAASAARTGLLLAAVGLLLGEVLGPQGSSAGKHLRETAKHGATMQKIGDGLWLRDGPNYIRIEGILAQDTLAGILIYTDSAQGSLASVLHARRAHYENAKWRLEDVAISRFSEQGVQVEHLPTMPWSVQLNPRVLRLSVVKPAELSSLGLYRYIHYLRSNGVAADDYSLAFWRNLMEPATVLVLCVFALPFCFGALRSAGAGQRLFVGGLVGVIFYMGNEIVANAGVVYGLAPWLAASLPTGILAVFTGYWIYRLN